jgi:uncharacterized protein YegL
MNDVYDGVGVLAKRQMVIFFLIDQSGSMDGTKIGAVNTAMDEILPELRSVGGAETNIKVALLLFAGGCQWMFAEPLAVDDPKLKWTRVKTKDDGTNFGAAFQELSQKMSRHAFLSAPSASVAPVIFLMSDGQPTDEYKDALGLLKNNNWFKHAIRVAIAIGDDADKNVLAEFTGNSEAVIKVHTPEALRKMIRFLALESADIGSKSQPLLSDDGSSNKKQNVVIQKAQNFLVDNPDIDQNAADDWE